MFKTAFLHKIHRHPNRNQWINGGLIHRVMSILKHLHQNLHRGLIQSYFIQDYNVIDQEDYHRLRTFEIKYVDLLRSQLKENIQAMSRSPLRRQTFAGSSPLDKTERIRLRSSSVAVLQ
jgi:Mab-21 protein